LYTIKPTKFNIGLNGGLMPLVFDRILASLKRFSAKTAIIDQGRSYTYEELDFYSERIASYLAKNNVQKDSKIAFLMRRSYHQLATILAIWKLGATYVPLDIKTPSRRLSRILESIEATCLVCESSFLNNIVSQNIPILTLTDPAFIEAKANSFAATKQGLLAYIIFTSGSTGEPKGVMISHENLSNHITWLIQDFGFSEKDCFSFNSSMAFDFSVACTILPLSIGATIVISTEVDTLDITTYCQQLITHKVTFAKWTPSYFRVLTDFLKDNSMDLSSFRFIMVAGEELLTKYADQWFKIYPTHTLINEYGPTETSVGITTYTFTKETLNQQYTTVPIGKPAINSKFYVIDSDNNLLDENQIGELLIGGSSVGLGYYNQAALTADRFISNPFDDKPEKLYKTGDLVRKLSDGNYLYLGRIDNQVKIRGYRIELNEIEHCILQHHSIKHAKLTVDKKNGEAPKIIAYLIPKNNADLDMGPLKIWLSQQLPSFMIPQHFFCVTHFPTNINGKIDFSLLKNLTEMRSTFNVDLDSTTVGKIKGLIQRYTGVENPDQQVSFYYLGLNSLLLTQLVNDINHHFQCHVRILDLFTYTNIDLLSEFIDTKEKELARAVTRKKTKRKSLQTPIAIIAMDCNLPGANNCEDLWELCQKGLEAIEHFPPSDKNESSSSKEKLVYARGTIEDVEYFDAHFFGFNANEAHLSDPQFRLLIESAWKSFEKAGYIPEQNGQKTGVFVSTNDSTYLLNHDLTDYLKSHQGDRFAVQRLMSPQCLATKIAYTLNCTGPSLTVQTACSASLVSVVLACQQLSDFQCDVAIAGGVSITTPQHQPYLYQQGNIFSPTGQCRPFDSNADGTVFSNGLGTIVLKRLEDAIRDNDNIISVIKGASTNNDGAEKMSFTAPSVKGQMECILRAQELAGIEASDVQYVETHGTGTFIGDPIEVAALSNAFRQTAKQNQFCAIGSLKANIGHTHVAAGVAGLIKTSLALSHQLIPPSINFETPNPYIDWENSPFYLNKKLQYWPQMDTPRRAAVSAFGVGGSNAHVILEEAPLFKKNKSFKSPFMLLFSAKSPQALEKMQDNFIQFLEKPYVESSPLLANAAYTLQVGRKKFGYTTGILCETKSEAISRLKENRDHFILSENNARLIFLFSGQIKNNLHFIKDLYDNEPTYSKHFDNCLNIASNYLNINLDTLLQNNNVDLLQIKQQEFLDILFFSIQYSLAQLLVSWGIKPDYLVSEAQGKFVAACLAKVFSLEEAIKLLCAQSILNENIADRVSLSDSKITEPFSALLSTLTIQEPTIPIFSHESGEWVNPETFKDEHYWFHHLLHKNLIPKNIERISSIPNAHLIELGTINIFQQLTPVIELFPKNQPNTVFQKVITSALKTLWCHGININWDIYHCKKRPKKIPLPNYPFEKKRYWFDQVGQEHRIERPNLDNAKTNLYVSTWVRDNAALDNKDISLSKEGRTWIIFANDTKICSHTIDIIKAQNNPVWIIKNSNSYKEVGNEQIDINPREESHYEKMIQTIVKSENTRCVILHFWPMNQSKASEDMLNDLSLYHTLFSGLYLSKAIYNRSKSTQVSCLMVTNQLQKVVGNEGRVPLTSSVLSLCRVFSLENRNFNFSNIDIDYKLTSNLVPIYTKHILKSVLSALEKSYPEEPYIASYRFGYRWREIYQTLDSAGFMSPVPVVKNEGTYLITGGLGAMGLTIADWLAGKAPATIVLLSRTTFPLEKNWDSWLLQHNQDDPTSQIIKKLKLIQNKGARLIIKTADVADLNHMKRLVKELQRKHEILGIFHLAGIPGEGLSLLKETHKIRSVLSAKVQGTYVLSQIFKNEPLDFFVGASSLTALAGGIGQLDYCAANLFLDYILSTNPFKNCKYTLTLNWNSWSSIGMATQLGASKTHEKLYLENSVTPSEAKDCLEQAMRSQRSQVIISRNDPHQERERIISAFANSVTIAPPSIEPKQQQNQINIIENLWKQTLGISDIEPEETFYSLGGDSLLAIQFLAQLENKIKINISLQEFSRVTTFASLLEIIKCKPLNITAPIIPLLQNVTHQESPAIYFIHPLGGTIFNYLALTPYLTFPAQYYAIQDPELLSNRLLFDSISDMAQYYANEISLHQSKKPVIIIGASFGGNIAIEMVSFLSSHQINVQKLILIDSWANLGKESHDPDNLVLDSLIQMKKYYGEHSQQYLRIKTRLSWLRTYKPSIVNTDVYLLTAKELLPAYKNLKEEANGWTNFCPSLILKDTVEGNHDTMFNSNHLAQLGLKITSILKMMENNEEIIIQSTELETI
jgi:amino acid adenylation domain-containing protein